MKINKYNKNIKKRKLYKKNELLIVLVKTLSLIYDINKFKWIVLKNFYNNFAYKYFQVGIKNFCIFTGRARSVSKKLQVSRIIFRKLSYSGHFFGLKKLSW